MSFVYDQKVVDSMYGSHVVSMAVDYGVDLVKMWPLQTNQELENDVKYAENLQVRVTHAFARILTGQDVTMPDAEFVYEGADEIPGRPQPYTKAWMCFPASIRKSSAR